MMEEASVRQALQGCRVAFRADGSDTLGFGHVMRTCNLASYLRGAGAEILFLTRASEPVLSWVTQRGIPVQTLPPELDEQDDLKRTLAALEGFRAEVVVTDLLNITQVYLAGLKAGGFLLVTLDVRNDIIFPSDIVINPNYPSTRVYRTERDNTLVLLGPQYFLLGPEFFPAHSQARVMSERGRCILVSMGGADHGNNTLRILRALTHLASDTIEVRALLGPFYPRSPQELKDALGTPSYNLDIISKIDSLVRFMLWCDLAITGAGQTVYESAATGTPSVALPANALQVAHLRDLWPLGTMAPLGLEGELTEASIAEVVRCLLQDGAARSAMSKNGKDLVDGLGHKRVLQAIAERRAGHRKAS